MVRLKGKRERGKGKGIKIRLTADNVPLFFAYPNRIGSQQYDLFFSLLLLQNNTHIDW